MWLWQDYVAKLCRQNTDGTDWNSSCLPYCEFVHNISFLMVKNEKCPWDSQVVGLLHIFVFKCIRRTGWKTSSIDAFMMQNHPLLWYYLSPDNHTCSAETFLHPKPRGLWVQQKPLNCCIYNFTLPIPNGKNNQQWSYVLVSHQGSAGLHWDWVPPGPHSRGQL